MMTSDNCIDTVRELPRYLQAFLTIAAFRPKPSEDCLLGRAQTFNFVFLTQDASFDAAFETAEARRPGIPAGFMRRRG